MGILDRFTEIKEKRVKNLEKYKCSHSIVTRKWIKTKKTEETKFRYYCKIFCKSCHHRFLQEITKQVFLVAHIPAGFKKRK